MTAHNIHEEDTIENAARGMPRIYGALDHRQADHQSNMIEVEGMIHNQSISILIDFGEIHSYIDPNLVERLHLEKCKHEHSWTVQLATGIRRKVSELVSNCPLDLNGLKTVSNLNILPLGSYHVLIGMDWLEPHRVVLDYFGNTITCLTDKEQQVEVKGIPRPVSLRKITGL